MTKVVDVVPSYAWDCIVCSRRSYQEYGLVVFDWNSESDMDTLKEVFHQEQLAQMKEKQPEQLRIYLERLFLKCQHCNFEFKLSHGEEE